MLHTLPAELIALILAELEPIEIINLGLSCKRLYAATNDQRLWRPYLIPEMQATSIASKTAFLETIENCQIQFWHLHPAGLESYKKLKFITQHESTDIAKARWILQSTHLEDYIGVIMALIHPEYRPIFAQNELNWPMMRITMLLVNKHPKILFYFLQDIHYKQACLSFYKTESSFLINFIAITNSHKAIALGYQTKDFGVLLDHMVTQLCKQQTLEKSKRKNATLSRSYTTQDTSHYPTFRSYF